MKIIFIAHKYDYGNPKLGLSYEYRNLYETLIRMNQGNNQITFLASDVINTEVPGILNQKLLEAIYQQKPDLIIFISSELSKEISKEVNKKTVSLKWYFDDHWKFEKHSRHYAFRYSWIATTDPLSIEKYQKIGYNNAIFLPQGCNPYSYQPLNLPKIYDVSFVGVAHGVRKKLIGKLRKNGLRVNCFGPGWKSGYISSLKMKRVFSQSKINLNFAQASGIWWKELALLFLHRRGRKLHINSPQRFLDSLKSFWPSMKSQQIKGRLFEIPPCGGFVLTGYAPKLEELYKIGKEIECFHNFDELVKKIRYYLKNENERERIARAGYERTLKEHTYEERFNKIFNIIAKH